VRCNATVVVREEVPPIPTRLLGSRARGMRLLAGATACNIARKAEVDHMLLRKFEDGADVLAPREKARLTAVLKDAIHERRLKIQELFQAER
jgi:hypothetical protein